MARPRRSRNTDQAKRTLTRHRARQTHRVTISILGPLGLLLPNVRPTSPRQANTPNLRLLRPWPSRAAATKRPSSPSSIASMARPRRSRNTDQAKRTLTRHRARQTPNLRSCHFSPPYQINAFNTLFQYRVDKRQMRILFAAMLYAFAAF
jgi:hypothetical protein